MRNVLKKEFPNFLAPSQRVLGRQRFLGFTLLNGASVTLVMQNMLILYAIRCGLNNTEVAAIASFLFLTMPFMIVGKWFVARMGLANAWGASWLFRYTFMVLVVIAPFLGSAGSPARTPALILAGAFFFFAFRSAGLMCQTPLLGQITTAQNRGSYIAKTWAYYNISSLLAMVVAYLLLKVWSGVHAFQLLLFLGTVIGFYSGYVILGIPESETPRQSARQPVLRSFQALLATRRYRRLLFAWAATMVSRILVNPFSMVALKNGYMINYHHALLFAVISIMGGIAASSLSSFLADRAGPRPLLIIYILGLLSVAVFWFLAPAVFHPIAAGLVFFVVGFCVVGLQASISHYFLLVTRDADRVSFSLCNLMFSGFVAGIVGTVGAGGLLLLLKERGETGIHVYHGFFGCVLVVLSLMLVLVWRLERLKEWKIRTGAFLKCR